MSAGDCAPYIEQWLPAALRAQRAYQVPSASGLIKLDAMENPYPWPEALSQAWSEHLRGVPLNRYPDAGASELRARLSAALQVPQGLSTVLGNGSDELIQLLAMAFHGPGRTLLAPEPGFVMYRMSAQALGMRFSGVPLREDFSLDPDAMLAALADDDPALVFIAYPNNPTGTLFDDDLIERIVERSRGLVVIDEAYQPFAGASWLGRVGDYPNLVVLRTLSKMGFAGLRLGMLFAAPAWGEQFEKLRMPYNVNCLTQATVAFALDHLAVFEAQTAAIRDERSRVDRCLRELPGLAVFESAANFILVRTPAARGNLHGALRERGILVKDLDQAYTATRHCLRLSIGTPEENDALLTALRELLA